MKQRILIALCTAATSIASSAAPLVPYPEGYRDWHHVKSMMIEEGHPLYSAFGGIHHLYANDLAMQGYRKGGFPDGAVIVFDLLEAVRQGNAVTEGRRKVVGVMHKDSKQYSNTGGWGFEGFGEGGRSDRVVRENAASACFACHAPRQGHDYTFSALRD